MLAIFHSMVLAKLVGNRWKGRQTVKSLRCARIQKLALEVFVGVFLNFGESKLAACPPAPSLYGWTVPLTGNTLPVNVNTGSLWMLSNESGIPFVTGSMTRNEKYTHTHVLTVCGSSCVEFYLSAQSGKNEGTHSYTLLKFPDNTGNTDNIIYLRLSVYLNNAGLKSTRAHTGKNVSHLFSSSVHC